MTWWPDPGIRRGALRVLPRTDGRWIVIDERRPVGDRTVALELSRDAAACALDRLAAAEDLA